MKRYLLMSFILLGFLNSLFSQTYTSPTYRSPTYRGTSSGQRGQYSGTTRQSFGTSNQSFGTSNQTLGSSDPASVNTQSSSRNSSQQVVTTSAFNQNETRKEFNRLLYGVWKNPSGSESILENGVEKLMSVTATEERGGKYIGEICTKDFKYLGGNIFECYAKYSARRGGWGDILEDWVKMQISVSGNKLECNPLETSKIFGRQNSFTMILVEKRTVYPPELIVELQPTSNTITSNSKINMNYLIKNVGKGSANSVMINLSADKSIQGLVSKAASYSDGFKNTINPNGTASGTFEISAGENEDDATVNFTLKVVSDDDYSTSKSVALITKPPYVRGLPPDLFAELNFKDDNNNGILEAMESATLYIKISNKGKGNAQNLKVQVEDNIADNNLAIGDYSLKLLEPGKSIDISIPIKADLNIKTTEHRLKLKVAEYFGYDMDDAFLILNTFAYQPPKLIFSGLEIIDSGDNTYAVKEDGLLQAGEQAKVKVVVQNIGQGDANNVNYSISSNNQDIFVDNNSNSLDNLKAGQTKEFTFIISPNKRVNTADKLPVYLSLKENIGQGNLTNFQLPITLNTRPPQTEILKVNSDFESLKKNIAKFEYNSNKFTMNTSNLIDIKTISASKIARKNSVAVIFGIEKYKELPPAPFASNDADLIKEYFQKRLGIDKIVIYKNDEVSGFIFDDVFNPDNGELQKAIVKGQTDLFVYYSGHGIPNKSGDNIYLFPSDGKISRLETQGYAINRLYDNLEKLGAKSVTVFIDACFSGSSRTTETKKTENLIAMKGVKIKPKNDGTYLNNPNFTVFNSSTGDETSLGYDASETGLYTYFLCVGLQGKADLNNDKKITFGELEKYLFDNVTETSRKISGVQTPEFFGNENSVLVEY